jgi:pimeloyl-ACP methyl ester carboxylesterase
VSTAVVAAEHRGGSGPPLLLLHGLTASFRIWEPVLEALEKHHDVLAPTLAGHRGGTPLECGIAAGVASLTDAVEHRLDELEIERPHIAGNSLGGWIALELARRGRARSVVALSPAGAWGTVAELERVRLLIRAGHLAAGIGGDRIRGLIARPRSRRLLLRGAFEHGERVPPAAVGAILADNVGCTVLDEFLRGLPRDGRIAGPIEPPDCPIRIAWGECDRTLPFERYGRPLLPLVPAAELVRLSGVGHVPMYDDPGLVASTILDLSSGARG